MTDSPPANPHEVKLREDLKHQQMKPPHEENDEGKQKERLCDYCNETTALLYCRADSARLCFSCDRQVHSANQLFVKHTRSLLCDACDESPASIFCETEHYVLCQNCDWETHNLSLCSLHNRRPIEGFTGCPSVSELVNVFGFDDLGNKALFLSEEKSDFGGFDDGYMESGFDGLLDSFVWETPAIASLDDLIVSSDTRHGFQAMDVPLLPKNRNATCGQHKEEMLHQLRELAKLEPNFSCENADVKATNGIQSLIPDQNSQPGNIITAHKHDSESTPFPANESSVLKWFNDRVEAVNHVLVPSSQSTNYAEGSFKDCDKRFKTSGQVTNVQEHQSLHLIAAGSAFPMAKVAAHELNSQERDVAITRYKEKKKTRRYEKHIRYASRKARAESRTRIKGRFAKVEH